MWSLVAVLLGTFVLRMASSIMGSTLQLYFGYIDRHFYPLSDTARGLALAIFFLPELIGSPVFGAWSDRLGRKWFILLGAIFGAIGVQMTAMTTNFAALALMRVLGGLSTASAIPATLGYLSGETAHSEAVRGRAMGLFQLATLAGTIGGMLLGGRLWDLYRQGTFTLDALLYLLSLAIFLVGIRETRVRKTPKDDAIARGWQALRRSFLHYQDVFTAPGVTRFAPVFLTICTILGIWMNHIVGQLVAADHQFTGQLLYGIFANDRHAGTEIALYGTLILAIFALGALVWSFVIGHFRRTAIMLVNVGALFVLCGVTLALNHSPSLAAPGIPVYLALAVLAIFVLSGAMPAALTYLADVTEERQEDRGAIMGLYTILFGLGGFLGTLIGGPFADWNAVDGILFATALLGVIATLLLVRLYQHDSGPAPQTSAILSKE